MAVLGAMTYEPIFFCKECGLIFNDKHANGVGGLAPAECPRCAEEQHILELSEINEALEALGIPTRKRKA